MYTHTLADGVEQEEARDIYIVHIQENGTLVNRTHHQARIWWLHTSMWSGSSTNYTHSSANGMSVKTFATTLNVPTVVNRHTNTSPSRLFYGIPGNHRR